VSAGITGGIPSGILRDMAAESKKRNKKKGDGRVDRSDRCDSFTSDRLGMAWPAEMCYESPNRLQDAAMAGSARPDAYIRCDYTEGESDERCRSGGNGRQQDGLTIRFL
jgi:hypothetical protein